MSINDLRLKEENMKKKKKWELKMTRRQVLKAGIIGGAGMMLPLRFLPAKAWANPAATGLHDPSWHFDNTTEFTAFTQQVPDALMPGFKYTPFQVRRRVPYYRVGVGRAMHNAGLVDSLGADLGPTTAVYGYGQIDGAPWYSWPGRTFEVQAGFRTVVQWSNNLPIEPHLLPVDTNLHWAYSLHGYMNYSIEDNGTPIVMHLHGGHNKDLFDGNPEQFFGPGAKIRGPRFYNNEYIYDNDRPAGNLWYHDHALGITRLNVYAGMAGFYFVRDSNDTGLPGNPLNLPAWPYEKAYAIQCRMFNADGTLFYPAYPGDPAYEGFIEDEGVVLHDNPLFPDNPRNYPTGNPATAWNGGGPTALAEFFGDHMVVNGIAWPKESVEPRYYRLHLLNGTDSRFMLIRFVVVNAGVTDPAAGTPINFDVIGSDQGLADSITNTQALLSEPGSRYDIIVNFRPHDGKRIIMQNLGGDEPFGTSAGSFEFDYTNRIMAFDVELDEDTTVTDVHPTNSEINFGPDVTTAVTRTRKVALFEGRDEFGRLQPLLGTAEPASDFTGRPINWPNTPVYQQAKLPDGTDYPLTGPMEGSIAWHSPTTENPALRSTEIWEVWNMTGDAHPIHLHLVHFEVIGRQDINFDDNADEDGFIPEGVIPADDGVYLVPQPTVQHNSVAGDEDTYGSGFRIVHPSDPDDAYGADPAAEIPAGIVENTPKDMAIALPGQITRIKARFDKSGRYVWHCHILSHEDHEMMRVLHVGGGHKDPSP